MQKALVPVLFDEGVAARVAELGMQQELQTMIDWTQQNVADLEGIRVELGNVYAHLGGKRNVVIWAHCPGAPMHPQGELIEMTWAQWKARTFPPRVCNHFIMALSFQPF